MNRYAELTESQRRQIDLLINSLASEPDHEPIGAMHWWIEMKWRARVQAYRAAEEARDWEIHEQLRRREQEDIDEANTIY
jgi:hypothetical protein